MCNNCHGYHCDEICRRKCRFTGVQPPPKNIYLSIREAAGKAKTWRASKSAADEAEISSKITTLKGFIKQLQASEQQVFFGPNKDKNMTHFQLQNRLQQAVFQKAQADPMVRQTLLDVQKQGVVLDANFELLAAAAVKMHQDEKKQAARNAAKMQDEIEAQQRNSKEHKAKLNLTPEQPTSPTPPIPDAKTDYQEKIFFDEIVGPKSYGRHIIGQVIGQGGSNRTRMESESG